MRKFGPETIWPPISHTVHGPLTEWDAWYRGEQTLRSVYAADPQPTGRKWLARGNRERLFWQHPRVEQRPKLHMPLANDIAASSAALLFAEEVEIDWGGGNETVLGKLLDGNDFHALLVEAAELASAVGGVFLRASWDSDIADHVLITTVGQDHVLPTFRYGRLTEAIVWSVVREQDAEVWRHLEYHEKGVVRHELRRGTSSMLGSVEPLTSIPATNGLPDSVPTGIDGLAVEYVPNILPTPIWRGDPDGHYLGRSDYGVKGVLGFMDALDEAWSSWMRDLRLGKARVMVASQMLESAGPGAGATVDLDREVYEGVRFAQGENVSLRDMVHSQQFSIRHLEHAATVEALMNVIVRASGYSGQTFGLTPDVPKTAREVTAVERKSAETRERKTRYWSASLERFLSRVVQMQNTYFENAGEVEPHILFPPESEPSELDRASAVQAFRAAEVMSIETGVKMAQPDLTPSEVAEEVARIEAEREAAMPVAGDAFMDGTEDDGAADPGAAGDAPQGD